jgi:hypothetical protein
VPVQDETDKEHDEPRAAGLDVERGDGSPPAPPSACGGMYPSAAHAEARSGRSRSIRFPSQIRVEAPPGAAARLIVMQLVLVKRRSIDLCRVAGCVCRA